MIDYKYYAIEFCRKLQDVEKSSDKLSVDDVELIRKFKNKLGYAVPESLEEGTGDKIREICLNKNCSELMLNEFKGFKLGSDVKVIDSDEQYTSYIAMVEVLIDNFNLSKDVLSSYLEYRTARPDGKEGIILAIGKHIDGDNDVLALVALGERCILISTKGLELLN